MYSILPFVMLLTTNTLLIYAKIKNNENMLNRTPEQIKNAN